MINQIDDWTHDFCPGSMRGPHVSMQGTGICSLGGLVVEITCIPSCHLLGILKADTRITRPSNEAINIIAHDACEVILTVLYPPTKSIESA